MSVIHRVAVVLALAGCGNKESASKVESKETTQPTVETTPEPKKETTVAAGGFVKERWVRTVMFDRKTPYVGFTYIDPSKGPSIKGEVVKDLSPADLKAKLASKLPSSTMSPLENDHPMTPLTAEEIAELGLPEKPDWLQFYEPRQ